MAVTVVRYQCGFEGCQVAAADVATINAHMNFDHYEPDQHVDAVSTCCARVAQESHFVAYEEPYGSSVIPPSSEFGNDTSSIDVEASGSSSSQRFHHWHEDHARRLLHLVQDNKHQLDDKMTRNKKIWGVIASELNKEYGAMYSGQKCNDKYKNMVRAFKSYVAACQKTGAAPPRKLYYFDLMESIIGNAHSVVVPYLDDSEAPSTAAMPCSAVASTSRGADVFPSPTLEAPQSIEVEVELSRGPFGFSSHNILDNLTDQPLLDDPDMETATIPARYRKRKEMKPISHAAFVQQHLLRQEERQKRMEEKLELIEEPQREMIEEQKKHNKKTIEIMEKNSEQFVVFNKHMATLTGCLSSSRKEKRRRRDSNSSTE